MTNWTPLGLGGYGNMTTPAISLKTSEGDKHPHIIVNCDMGGAYMSRDLGKHWQIFHYRQLQGNTGISPVFSSTYGKPGKPQLIFAASAWGELKYSKDGGANWYATRKPPTGSEMRLHGEIALHPDQKTIFMGGSMGNFSGYALFMERCTSIDLDENGGGIFRSNDLGDTWKKVFAWISEDPPQAPPRGSYSSELLGFPLTFHIDRRISSDGNTVFAATQRAILVSTDAGDSWAKTESNGLPGPPPKKNCNSCELVNPKTQPIIRSFAGASQPDGPLRLYCTTASRIVDQKIDGGVYLSTDEGKSWRRLVVEPNEDTSFGDDYPDGSGNSTQCNLLQFHHIVTSNENPNLIYVLASNTGSTESDLNVGVHSTVYRSTDGGNSWGRTFYHYPPFLNSARPKYNVSRNWATARISASEKLSNSITDEPSNGLAVSPDQASAVVRVGTRCFVKQPGDSDSWLSADSSLVEERDASQIDADTGWNCNGLVVTSAWNYYIDPTDPERHYIAYTDCNYARSKDAGESWIWGGSHNAGEEKPWQNAVFEMAFAPMDETAGEAQPKPRMWAAFSSLGEITGGNAVLFYHSPPGKEDKNGRVGYSSDFGKTWKFSKVLEKIEDPSTPPKKEEQGKPVTSLVYSKHEKALYAAVYEDGIYRAEDTPSNELDWICISANLDDLRNRRFSRLIAHKDGTRFALITARTSITTDGTPCFGEPNDGVGLYRLDRDAKDWQPVGQFAGPRIDWPRDFVVDENDSQRIYIAASEPRSYKQDFPKGFEGPKPCGRDYVPPEQSGIYTLDASTNTWQRLPLAGIPCSFRHSSVYIHPTRPHWLYVTLAEGIGGVERQHAGLWLSKDGGKTCHPFSELPFKHVVRVSVKIDDAGKETLYACTYGAGVWRGPSDPKHEKPFEFFP